MAQEGRIYAFFGADDVRVKEDALELSRKLVAPDNVEFGLEIVSGNADNSEHAARIIARAVEAIQTLPFLGNEKTVWLQGVNFFGDTVTGRSASTLEALDRLIAEMDIGLPPGVSLIISGAEIDKRRSFYKKLNKLGQVTTHNLPDPNQPGWEQKCAAMAERRARKFNLMIEPEALDHFVAVTGENTRILDAELQKLALYVGHRGRATLDDVRAVVAVTRTGVIFEIGDAIAERDLPRTLSLIDRQLRKGESAIGILMAAIVPRIRNLLLARDLEESHGVRAASYGSYQATLNSLPRQATAHLPRKKDGGINAYPIFLAAKSCGRFSSGELRAGLKGCLEANLRLVTSQLAPRTVLAQLVTGLMDR